MFFTISFFKSTYLFPFLYFLLTKNATFPYMIWYVRCLFIFEFCPKTGLYILEETKTYPYCSLPAKRKISKSDLFKMAGRRRKLAQKEMQKHSRQDQGEDYDEEENVDKGLEVKIEIGRK